MAKVVAALALATKAGLVLAGIEGAALAFHLGVITTHIVGAGLRDTRRRAALEARPEE